MDIFQLILVVMFFAALIVATPQYNNYKRNKSKDRRKRCLSDAETNVRITDPISNTTYRPISELPQEGEAFDIDVETIKGHRTQKTFLDVLPSELKHDPMETIRTGHIHYRLVRNNLGDNTSSAPGEHHPSYTDEELIKRSGDSSNEIIKLEGQLAERDANIQEKVTDIVEKKGDFVSKLPGGSGK